MLWCAWKKVVDEATITKIAVAADPECGKLLTCTHTQRRRSGWLIPLVTGLDSKSSSKVECRMSDALAGADQWRVHVTGVNV